MKTFLEVGAKNLVDVYGHQAKKLVELAVGDWALKGERRRVSQVLSRSRHLASSWGGTKSGGKSLEKEFRASTQGGFFSFPFLVLFLLLTMDRLF